MSKIIAVMPVLLVLSVVFVSGCTTQQPPEDSEKPLIGGERDEHGCLGPAGYTWNEGVGACIRTWELDDNQTTAAGIAVERAGKVYATTVSEVIDEECEGCFTVKLQQGEFRDAVTVDVIDWTAASQTMTYHVCTEEEKAAEICTMEYVPVCGFMTDGSSETYGNKCGACAAGADYWELGECVSE